jgi:hypothetical protein
MWRIMATLRRGAARSSQLRANVLERFARARRRQRVLSVDVDRPDA